MATYNGTSIVDYLKSTGGASDFASRTSLATSKGITNYTGTAAQNTQLLGILRTPTPVVAPAVNTPIPPATAPTTVSNIPTTNSGVVTMPSNSPTFGNTASASASVAGITAQQTSVDQQTADRAKMIKEEQDAVAKENKPFLDKFLKSPTPVKAREDATLSSGIDTLKASKLAKVAEVETLNIEYNKIKGAMDAELANNQSKMATTGFISASDAAIQRKYAPELNRISADVNTKTATLQLMNGEISAAQDSINQAVQDATAMSKYNFDLYQVMAKDNQDIMDRMDSPYKTAFDMATKIALEEYKQTQDNANSAGSAIMKFNSMGAGILITDSPAQVAQKVASVGGDLAYYNAQQKAQAQYSKSGTTTGNMSGLSSSQQTAAFKLADDYEQASKAYFTQRDAFNRIGASANDPSAAGDLALIFNYMKVLDPLSVVREGEFATAANAGSIPERIIGQYNKVISGERLAETQRQDFVDRAGRLFTSAENQQKAVNATYANRAEKYGIPTDFVTRDTSSTSNPVPPPAFISDKDVAKLSPAAVTTGISVAKNPGGFFDGFLSMFGLKKK